MRLLHSLWRKLFACKHRRLVYPPSWYGNYGVYVCFNCGRKQLRDATGDGIGEFSHDVDELIRAREAPTPTRPLDSTTLVFRNGARREIDDYALVDDKVLVFTGEHTAVIFLKDLNLPATVAANAQRGRQFRLPLQQSQSASPAFA